MGRYIHGSICIYRLIYINIYIYILECIAKSWYALAIDRSCPEPRESEDTANIVESQRCIRDIESINIIFSNDKQSSGEKRVNRL